MTRIRVLPEVLANKIAAGEIVERPASVVKELVENSLDAGAGALDIAFETGGKRLVRVRDDGEGMTQDDAILAFEHHATSKIRSADDLAAIATLGFRGEALPSIAAVSRLTLRTRAAMAPASASEAIPGTEVEFQGGALRSVKAVAWDRGTEVSVRDLFFNLPARRKFLRSRETEASHITRLVTHYALASPALRVKLASEGRPVLDLPPAAGLRDRVHQLFGEGFLENLVPIEGRLGDLAVAGFTSLAREQRTNTHYQFFYVNGRVVRDKVLTGAVRHAYRHTIPGSAHPVVLLFLTLPFDQVDVNAHPAKVEVRFRDQATVYELVRQTLVRALGSSVAVPAYEHRRPAPFEFRPSAAETGEALRAQAPAAGADALQRAFDYPGPPPAPDATCREELAPAGGVAESAPEAGVFAPGGVRVLGQIHESYIIAADRRGLLIVDQHVAHERVLYEANARAMRERGVESQGLVVPLTVDLAPHQEMIFERAAGELERNGFAVEHFGGSTLVIRAVPALARDADARKLIVELIDGLGREERSLDLDRIGDRLAVDLACRAAIKVNTPLAPEKMQWLLDALSRTRVPTHCPHGRPIVMRLEMRDIERNFRRI
jgi:DNA mismatch repair protein MutL